MIVDQDIFIAFCTMIIVATCVGWMILQIVRLRRNLAAEREHNDDVFGNIIGIIIMLIGLVGVAKFYWFPS